MKPPAFQLYADDFLAGTADMTNEEVGAFIRLLCQQWSKGSLPNDPARLALMAAAISQPALGYVMAKFELCPDGMLRNRRLEAERAKQAKFREMQAVKGRAGGTKRWRNGTGHGPGMAVAMAGPMTEPKPEHGLPSPSPILTPPTPKGDVSVGFAEFWTAYPRKIAKATAVKVWARLKPNPELVNRIVDDLNGRRISEDWTKDGGRFVPHPATYLSGRRWEDEASPTTVEHNRPKTDSDILAEVLG